MNYDLNSLPPQFAEIRRRILEAEAKGLITIPEIQLDVPEGETSAETVARMERMAGFLPQRVLTNLKTWDGLAVTLPTPDEMGMTAEQEQLARLFGMPVVIDPTMPDGEMEIRSGDSVARLVNIGKDAE